MAEPPAEHQSRIKKILPRLLILGLVIAICVGGWYIDAQRAKARSVLSGYFESEPSQLASRVQGRVATILVVEGQQVRAGDPLVILSVTPEELSAQSQQAKAEQARQQLTEARNGPTAQLIAEHQAAVAERTAELAKLRNGPLPQEIAQSAAALRAAQANQRKVDNGPRPQEISQAKDAALASKAKLDELLAGNRPEDIAQAKARLDSAVVDEDKAAADDKRYDALYAQDAVTRQDRDHYDAALAIAQANEREMAQAYRSMVNGPRPEDIAQAWETYQQQEAALNLLLAGSRTEDKQAAAAQVAQAQQALDLLLRGTRPEDIAAGIASLAQAQAVLNQDLVGVRKEEIAADAAAAKSAALTAKSAQSTVADRTVRAPRDGVVERVLVAVGDLVNVDAPIIRFSDPSDIWLRVFVPEGHLSQTLVGADATIHVDGISSPLDGVVESVATQGEFTPVNLQTPEERGMQVFSVRVRLKTPDRHVQPGMYATVTRIGRWTP